MNLILIVVVLFFSFILNIPTVSAQTACKIMLSCEDPTHIVRTENGRCAPRSVPIRPEAPAPQTAITSASCPAGTCPDSALTDGSCICIPEGPGCAMAIPTNPGLDPETAPADIVTKAREAEAIDDAKAPEPSPDECTLHPEKCSRGGGRPCDVSTGKPFAEADPTSPNTKEGRTTTANNRGIMTAIGCIPTQPQLLVEGLLRYGTLAAGGIAFLLMILAAFEMITAEGNPEIIKKAQEKFYSAIIGLLLVIFSVLLMQIIGVDVLSLPGFGPT